MMFIGVKVASRMTSSKVNVIRPESRSIVYDSSCGRDVSGVKTRGW